MRREMRKSGTDVRRLVSPHFHEKRREKERGRDVKIGYRREETRQSPFSREEERGRERERRENRVQT